MSTKSWACASTGAASSAAHEVLCPKLSMLAIKKKEKLEKELASLVDLDHSLGH